MADTRSSSEQQAAALLQLGAVVGQKLSNDVAAAADLPLLAQYAPPSVAATYNVRHVSSRHEQPPGTMTSAPTSSDAISCQLWSLVAIADALRVGMAGDARSEAGKVDMKLAERCLSKGVNEIIRAISKGEVNAAQLAAVSSALLPDSSQTRDVASSAVKASDWSSQFADSAGSMSSSAPSVPPNEQTSTISPLTALLSSISLLSEQHSSVASRVSSLMATLVQDCISATAGSSSVGHVSSDASDGKGSNEKQARTTRDGRGQDGTPQKEVERQQSLVAQRDLVAALSTHCPPLTAQDAAAVLDAAYSAWVAPALTAASWPVPRSSSLTTSEKSSGQLAASHAEEGREVLQAEEGQRGGEGGAAEEDGGRRDGENEGSDEAGSRGSNGVAGVASLAAEKDAADAAFLFSLSTSPTSTRSSLALPSQLRQLELLTAGLHLAARLLGLGFPQERVAAQQRDRFVEAAVTALNFFGQQAEHWASILPPSSSSLPTSSASFAPGFSPAAPLDIAARLQAATAAASLLLASASAPGHTHLAAASAASAACMKAANTVAKSRWRKLPGAVEFTQAACSAAVPLISSTSHQPHIQPKSEAAADLLLALRTLLVTLALQRPSEQQQAMTMAAVHSTALLLRDMWPHHSTAAKTALLAIAAYIQGPPQLQNQPNLLLSFQSSIISSLSLLVQLLASTSSSPAAAVCSVLLSQLTGEGGQQAAARGKLRERLLEGLATCAASGNRTTFQEASTFLTESYLSSAMQSLRGNLQPEQANETVEQVLPNCLLILAKQLPSHLSSHASSSSLRSDLRHRLLSLFCEIALAAESDPSLRKGADALGPLLPAIAETCCDLSPLSTLPPSHTKLFTSLWFYIALFSLAPSPPPPSPNTSSSSSIFSFRRRKSSGKADGDMLRASSGRSTSSHASNNSDTGHSAASAASWQAAIRCYEFALQWGEAARRLAVHSPAIVLPSHSEHLFLSSLLNPGSPHGISSSKAAAAQRKQLAALLEAAAAAAEGKEGPGKAVSLSGLADVSGLKCLHLTSVALLEWLRFTSSAGIILKQQQQQQQQPQQAALKCSAFAVSINYLLSPARKPVESQVLAAIFSRSLHAALSSMNLMGEDEAHEAAELHGSFLLECLYHPVESVRSTAAGLLSQLREWRPKVLFSLRCYQSLLSPPLLHHSSHSSSSSPSYSSPLPFSSPTAPSSSAADAAHAAPPMPVEAQNLISDWLPAALSIAPVATQSILQEALLHENGTAASSHSNALLSALLSAPTAEPSAPSASATAAAAARDCIASSITFVILKSRYVGFVDGLIAAEKWRRKALTGGVGEKREEAEEDVEIKALIDVCRMQAMRLRHLAAARGMREEETQGKEWKRWRAKARQLTEEGSGEKETKTEEKGSDEEFKDALLQSAALVIRVAGLKQQMLFQGSELHLERHSSLPLLLSLEFDLLSLIVHLPLQIFSQSAISHASLIWSWLLAACPTHPSYSSSSSASSLPSTPATLLSLLLSSWTALVSHGWALFSLDDEIGSPAAALRPLVAAGQPDPEELQTGDEIYAAGVIEGIRAHSLWLHFMLDLLKVVQLSADSSALALQSWLLSSLTSPPSSSSCSHPPPSPLSSHPLARAAIFSLISATLSFCHCQLSLSHSSLTLSHQQSEYRFISLSLLRERAHRSALFWFSTYQPWHGATDKAAEVAALHSFLDALHADEQHEIDFAAAQQSALDSEPLTSAAHHLVWGPQSSSAAAPGAPGAAEASCGWNPPASSAPASAGATAAVEGSSERRRLLQLLVKHELDCSGTWHNPLKTSAPLQSRLSLLSSKDWTALLHSAWAVSPQLAIALTRRFPTSEALSREAVRLIKSNPLAVVHCPEALPLVLTPEFVQEEERREENKKHQQQQQQQEENDEEDETKATSPSPSILSLLPLWAPLSISDAMSFLSPDFKGNHRLMAFVFSVLEAYPPSKVTFFMPQLVQALKFDHDDLIEGYLIRAAQRDNVFAHILIWQLQGEEAPPADSEDASNSSHNIERTTTEDDSSKPPPSAAHPSPPPPPAASDANPLWAIVPRVRQRIIDSFNSSQLAAFHREFDFFDQVTSISGTLRPVPKEKRREAIRPELEKIEVTGSDIYLPTDPSKLVRGIVLDSGIPLQSAKKVPIMISFQVVDAHEAEGEEREATLQPQACIFKVGDDCRQDVLALQLISILRDVNKAAGLDLYLFPYGVLPTGYERGIIEVVPNTVSRNQMGEMADGGLLDFFHSEFGVEGSESFERARHNFISSSAAYAIASLLIQPKDRHNGNLLIDRVGHLVHIDFGFILETSPAGNLRFESADFKLSHEMTQIIDPSGVRKSETWFQFVSLCVRSYLVARSHHAAIIHTVRLMLESGLPCFSRGDPIGNLRKRFHLDMTEREAANFMIGRCKDAYNKWTTAGYDLIQYLQQGIEK